MSWTLGTSEQVLHGGLVQRFLYSFAVLMSVFHRYFFPMGGNWLVCLAQSWYFTAAFGESVSGRDEEKPPIRIFSRVLVEIDGRTVADR